MSHTSVRPVSNSYSFPMVLFIEDNTRHSVATALLFAFPIASERAQLCAVLCNISLSFLLSFSSPFSRWLAKDSPFFSRSIPFRSHHQMSSTHHHYHGQADFSTFRAHRVTYRVTTTMTTMLVA